VGAHQQLCAAEKKSRERLILNIRGISRRQPALFERAAMARQLNALNGTHVFTAWNVEQIPLEDLEDVLEWLHWRAVIS